MLSFLAFVDDETTSFVAQDGCCRIDARFDKFFIRGYRVGQVSVHEPPKILDVDDEWLVRFDAFYRRCTGKKKSFGDSLS